MSVSKDIGYLFSDLPVNLSTHLYSIISLSLLVIQLLTMRVISTILIGLTATNVATAFTISSPLSHSSTAKVGIQQPYFQQHQNVVINKPSSSTTQLFMGWGPGTLVLFYDILVVFGYFMPWFALI